MGSCSLRTTTKRWRRRSNANVERLSGTRQVIARICIDPRLQRRRLPLRVGRKRFFASRHGCCLCSYAYKVHIHPNDVNRFHSRWLSLKSNASTAVAESRYCPRRAPGEVAPVGLLPDLPSLNSCTAGLNGVEIERPHAQRVGDASAGNHASAPAAITAHLATDPLFAPSALTEYCCTQLNPNRNADQSGRVRPAALVDHSRL